MNPPPFRLPSQQPIIFSGSIPHMRHCGHDVIYPTFIAITVIFFFVSLEQPKPTPSILRSMWETPAKHETHSPPSPSFMVLTFCFRILLRMPAESAKHTIFVLREHTYCRPVQSMGGSAGMYGVPVVACLRAPLRKARSIDRTGSTRPKTWNKQKACCMRIPKLD